MCDFKLEEIGLILDPHSLTILHVKKKKKKKHVAHLVIFCP
jgi:hypothetical protein